MGLYQGSAPLNAFGLSAYQQAVQGGFTGTEAEFNASLAGAANKVSASAKLDMNIAASVWNNGIYLLQNENITATNVVELIPQPTINDAQLESLQQANIVGGTQVAGSIQLVCKGEVPTIALPVTFIFRRDT